MNIKYTVDLNDKVTVITDTGETIERKDKYTKNTDTILSLERLSESIENKIKLFERRLNELNSKIRQKRKMIRILNIALILFASALLVLSGSISTKLFLSVIIGSIPAAIIVGLIENILIKKDTEKKDYCIKRIKEETHRAEKIQTRIDKLSKDKTPKEIKHNTFIEIKLITDYNIDTTDYFIENYLITKRVQEMTKGKKKVKKKSKQKNNLSYEF